MKALIIILAVICSGCSMSMKPEDAAKIDNNFRVVDKIIRGMDERLKKLETQKAPEIARPGRSGK